MPDALRDQNRVTSLIGLADDGVTINRAKVDGVTGRLLLRVAAAAGSSLLPTPIAPRDQNRVTVGMGELTDGTPQAIQVDADRNLFVSASI